MLGGDGVLPRRVAARQASRRSAAVSSRSVDTIFVLVASLVVGAFLGVWLGEFLKRPKLKAAGSSGGGGPSFGYVNAMGVTNEPAFLGLSAGDTIIFGRRIHSAFAIGLPISRYPATGCRATLHDLETDEFVAHLWWRTRAGNSTEYPQVMTLDAGESGELMLFARQDQHGIEYFPFAPAANRSVAGAPLFEPPAETLRFRDDRTFRVRIMYGYLGRQVRTFPVAVKRLVRGGLVFEIPARRTSR